MRSLAVFVGGALGALARWGIGLALAGSAGTFPLATLLVNVSGAFGLGFAAAVLTERMPPNRLLRPLLGAGFFGAYTTFSTMAFEGVRLLDNGHVATAVTYWIVTLIGGQMAGVYGMWLARINWRARREAT